MKKPVFIMLLLSVLHLQCQKQGVLPAVTQHGANTLGCTVNGAIFTPNTTLFSGLTRLQAFYDDKGKNNYYLQIETSSQSTSEIIKITSGGQALTVGSKIVLKNYDNTAKPSAEYITAAAGFDIIPPLTGELDITYIDTNAKIISGTFFFDAVDANGNKVTVRDGVFDVQYQ